MTIQEKAIEQLERISEHLSAIGEKEDYTDVAIQALEQQPNRCDSCTHSEEQDGSNCYECVKGMADNFEAQPTEIRDATEEERKSVKDYVESISKPTGFNFYEAQLCEDCISREAVIEHICEDKECYKEECKGRTLKRCYDLQWVFDLPPVTPQRPKGKWIEYKVDIAPHPLHCSLCGFSNHHISNRYMREFRRCPNCGAEMSEGGGEE